MMKTVLIPQPREVDLQQLKSTNIGIHWDFDENIFSADFSRHTAPFALAADNLNGRIELDSLMHGSDAYRLEFSADEWRLTASSEAAAFYGLMTAKQLLRQRAIPQAGAITDAADFERRIIQVDLKVLGWNVDYWLSLPRYFAELKINCILLEIEDKFPFKKHPAIANEPFTLEQWQQWIEQCRLYHIEIIPLIQCLGHWEYILKHPEYASIRELPHELAQGCPSNPATFKLFTELVEEILPLFHASKMICVGGDETRLLGRCDQCHKIMATADKGYIYATYMNRILSWVRSKGYRPMAWADMFLSHPKILTDYITEPPLLLDWDYNVRQIRAHSVHFRALNLRRVTFADWSAMDKTEQNRWQPFLQPDPANQTLHSLPGTRFIKSHGAEMFGGASIINPASISVHAYWNKRYGNHGLLTTYWAASNSLALPYTIYEMRKQNIALAAAISWKYDTEIAKTGEWLAALNQALGCNYNTAKGAFFTQESHLQPNTVEIDIDLAKSVIEQPGELLPDGLFKKLMLEQQFNHLKQQILTTPLGGAECWKTIDFGKLANDYLTHTEARPGFSYQQGNDLSNYPTGTRTVMGIPIYVKPAINESKQIITVANNQGNNSVTSLKTIPIESEVFSLHLTHLWLTGDKGDNEIGYYRLHYADKSFVDIPIIIDLNCAGWWHASDTKESVIAWHGANAWCDDVGVSLFSFKPKSGYITHIEIKATAKATISLLGITVLPEVAAIKVADEIVNTINGYIDKFEALKLELEQIYLNYVSAPSARQLANYGCNSYLYQLQLLKTIVN